MTQRSVPGGYLPVFKRPSDALPAEGVPACAQCSGIPTRSSHLKCDNSCAAVAVTRCCYVCVCCLQVPQFKLPPQPWEPGWKLQDGLAINRDLHELMTVMLAQIRQGISGTARTGIC